MMIVLVGGRDGLGGGGIVKASKQKEENNSWQYGTIPYGQKNIT
jgi:hypothetical protein